MRNIEGIVFTFIIKDHSAVPFNKEAMSKCCVNIVVAVTGSYANAPLHFLTAFSHNRPERNLFRFTLSKRRMELTKRKQFTPGAANGVYIDSHKNKNLIFMKNE